MVAGRLVLDEGRITTVDEDAVRHAIEDAADRLLGPEGVDPDTVDARPRGGTVRIRLLSSMDLAGRRAGGGVQRRNAADLSGVVDVLNGLAGPTAISPPGARGSARSCRP